MSNLPECVDCGKVTDDLDKFMSCPSCSKNREIKMAAEDITGEAVIRFVGHTCHHKHPTKLLAEKCARDRENKIKAFCKFTAIRIRKIHD